MKRFIAALGCVLLSGIPAFGDPIYPVNFADVTFWSYPTSPQSSDSLPTGPDGIPLESSGFYQDGSAPFDRTFSGTAPEGGDYSIHVRADAGPTGVHAAFQTTYSAFHGSNMLAPFYLNDQQSIVTGNLPQIGYLSAYMQDTVTVAGGPTGASYGLTLQVHVDGSNTNSWVYGGLDNNGPSSVGAYFVNNLPNGEAVNIRSDGTYDETLSVTSVHAVGSEAFFQYGFNIAQYSPYWVSPEAARAAYLTGSIDYNFSSTATVEKIIILLPYGSDPSKFSASFGSGADYNVEFQVASPVPEPSSVILLGMFATTCAVIGLTRRSLAA